MYCRLVFLTDEGNDPDETPSTTQSRRSSARGRGAELRVEAL